MKSKFCLLTALLLPFSAQAGDMVYGIEAHAKGALGYSETKKHHHGLSRGNIDSFIGYEIDKTNSYTLHMDIMGGINEELQDYNQGRWGEEVYIVADTAYGQLMGGQVYNVASLFHNAAPAVGILNSNSEVADFLHNPNWRRTKKETKFVTLPSTDINTDGVAPKINYISPEIGGTAVGLSWMPNSYNRRGLINKHAGYAHKDGFAAALYSDHRLGNFNTKTSFAYAQYNGNDKEFSFSSSLNRGNWTIGAGARKTYIDGEDKSSFNREMPQYFDGYREGYAWNIGLGYEIGPFASSLSFFQSKQKHHANKNDVIVWSNEYQFNRYVDFYLASAWLKYRETTTKDNGAAIVIGAGVNF